MPFHIFDGSLVSWTYENALSSRGFLAFFVLKSLSTSLNMLILIQLTVFSFLWFTPVDAIPRPTPKGISRSKSDPGEQIVIRKPPGINLHTSQLQNWYHHPCTRDISTRKGATRNGELSKSSSLFCLKDWNAYTMMPKIIPRTAITVSRCPEWD
jgi:hypothetical protein